MEDVCACVCLHWLLPLSSPPPPTHSSFSSFSPPAVRSHRGQRRGKGEAKKKSLLLSPSAIPLPPSSSPLPHSLRLSLCHYYTIATTVAELPSASGPTSAAGDLKRGRNPLSSSRFEEVGNDYFSPLPPLPSWVKEGNGLLPPPALFLTAVARPPPTVQSRKRRIV